MTTILDLSTLTEVYRYQANLSMYWQPVAEDFEDQPSGVRVGLELLTFKVIRATPCGLWISYYGKDKFISMRARKQFAAATKVEALDSYIARKNRHISILKSQLSNARIGLKLANRHLLTLSLEATKEEPNATAQSEPV